MVTHSSSMEAGSAHFDVVAATSFVDVSPIADPEPLIAKQPELFVEAWDGPTEVVALIDESRVAAAGVLRYRSPNPNTLEAYVIGEVDPGVDHAVLKDALRKRVEQRRAAMLTSEDGAAPQHPVHTTVYWGQEPPAIAVSSKDPGVGVNGYKQRLQRSRSFMEDLKTPYGELTF
jgi:hypothetical protein